MPIPSRFGLLRPLRPSETLHAPRTFPALLRRDRVVLGAILRGELAEASESDTNGDADSDAHGDVADEHADHHPDEDAEVIPPTVIGLKGSFMVCSVSPTRWPDEDEPIPPITVGSRWKRSQPGREIWRNDREVSRCPRR